MHGKVPSGEGPLSACHRPWILVCERFANFSFCEFLRMTAQAANGRLDPRVALLDIARASLVAMLPRTGMRVMEVPLVISVFFPYVGDIVRWHERGKVDLRRQ
jgi:hypothetical protein